MTQNIDPLLVALKPFMPGLEDLGHRLIGTYPAAEIAPHIASRILVPVQLPAALLLIALAHALLAPEAPKGEPLPEIEK